MGHILVYDAYSLHYMMLQFAASQYYVRDDNKLGSRPVPSIRVSIRKMLGYPLLWTIYLKIHLLFQVFYLLGYLIFDVTSEIPIHIRDLDSEIYLGIEAGFSLYTVTIRSEEAEEKSEEILVYPEDEEEGKMVEIFEDDSITHEEAEDVCYGSVE